MRIALMSALVALCIHVAIHAADADPECVALAQSVEAAARKQDFAALAPSFDMDVFCQRMRGNNTEDQAFFDRFTGGFKKTPVLATMLMRVAKDGQLTFLHVRTKGTEQRALFRIQSAEGVNYCEALCVRVGGQKPKIVDMYIYMSGEYFSDTIRVMYQAAMKKENPTVYQRLFGGGTNMIDALPKMDQMRQQMQTQNYKAALETFNTIPKEHQTWKPALILRIRVARNVSEQHWLDAIQEYERAYPTDAALNFIKIDAFLIQKKYDEALKNVDALDVSVGGDPYLNVLRANMYSKAGRHDKALELARKSIAEMPDAGESNGCYIDCLVAAKDYPGAVKALDGFTAKFGWDDASLLNDPQYQPFFASREYKEWKAKRKQ